MLGNFLTQILERPARRNAPFDLLFINREKLVMNTATDSSFPWLRILRKNTHLNSTVRTLNFSRWDFSNHSPDFPRRLSLKKRLRRAGCTGNFVRRTA